MSLESKIEALTLAVAALTAVMQQGAQPTQASVTPSFVPQQAPVNTAPTIPAGAPGAVQQGGMPPTPNFLAQPATSAPAGAPFTDAKGLVDYAMGVYKVLGPEKGAGVQTIIGQLGHQNINDVRPDQYGQFYAMVEALKAS